MATKTMRTLAAFALATVIMSRGVAVAQTPSGGWPEAVEAKKAAGADKPAPAVTPKPAPSAATAKPSATPPAKPSATPPAKPAVAKVVKPEAPAAAPKAAALKNELPKVEAPKAEAAKPPSSEGIPSEVVTALQQQAELMKRLADEIQVQRNVIKEQQDKIKALEIKANAPIAPAKATPPPPPPNITVETGGIKLKVGGLVQGWFTAGNANYINSFRLRRAEIKFVGDMSPRLKWTLMVDPAKALAVSNTTASVGGANVIVGSSISQSGRMLQDAFVSLNWKPSLWVEIGQQKIPLGMEGTQSSGKLDVIERALFMTDKARGVGYGDVRDMGITVRGKLVGGQVEYTGAVFNGLGENMNDVDKNTQKEYIARLITKPKAVKGLQFGGSFARESFDRLNASARERQGVELMYVRSIWTLKSEVMGGRDAAVTRLGAYGQLSARVTKPMTVLFRYDAFDPDTRSEKTAATVAERDYLGGFTYLLGNSGAWLQFNYVHKTFGAVAASREVFMTNLQTTW